MIAGKYNIICEQGATFYRTIRVNQPDESGDVYVPMPLTGFTARMDVRRDIDSAVPLISLTTENGGIAVEPSQETGVLTLLMTATQTAALTSDGIYDLEIISPTGYVSRVIQGTFKLSREVTR